MTKPLDVKQHNLLNIGFQDFGKLKQLSLKDQAERRIRAGENLKDVVVDLLVKNGVSPLAIRNLHPRKSKVPGKRGGRGT